MNKIEIWYLYKNKVTSILYNERDEIQFEQIQGLEISHWVNKIDNKRVKWLGIWKELKNIINLNDLQVYFYGRKEDCCILKKSIFNDNEINIHCSFEVIEQNNNDNYCLSQEELISKAISIQKNNPKECYKLLLDAYNQGSIEASYYLGEFCLLNKDMDNNQKKAFDFFEYGANKNYGKSQRELGYAYFKGIGVDVDYSRAIKYFMCAAQNGDKNGQYNLGICMLNGYGVEASVEKAIYWLKKAAEQGEKDAQYELGKNYYFSSEKNIKESLRWLYLALENGKKEADILIDKILEGELYE